MLPPLPLAFCQVPHLLAPLPPYVILISLPPPPFPYALCFFFIVLSVIVDPVLRLQHLSSFLHSPKPCFLLRRTKSGLCANIYLPPPPPSSPPLPSLSNRHSDLRQVSPFTIPALLGNTAAGVIAIETGAQGPNFGIVSACATATHCLGEAMQAIQEGEVLLVHVKK